MATLRIGSKGPEVRALQMRLNSLGFNAGAEDGVYGPKTSDALKAFQAKIGVRKDGIFGPLSRARLEKYEAKEPEKGIFNIVLPSSTDFDVLKPGLIAKYNAARIRPEYAAVVKSSATTALKHKKRYEAVARFFGKMPWFFVAALHMRESTYGFSGVLHNGEKILGTGRKTKLVPKGRGPFTTWEEAALDALEMKYKNRILDWDLPRILYEMHRYNGWGPLTGAGQNSIPRRSSAYLWSMTSEYTSGKYVRDGVWSSTAVDKQVGCAALLKQLEQNGHIEVKQ